MRPASVPRAPFLLAVLSLSLVASLLFASFGVPLAEASPDARDVALAEALRTRRLHDVRFEETTLDGLVKWLRVATGVNVHVKTAALAKAGVDVSGLRFTATLDDVALETLLKLLLEPHGLAAKVEGNVLFVTTKADAAGKPVTRLHAISHITFTKIDFIAPAMDLRPSGYTPAEEYEPEKVVENDPLNTGEAVVELVKEIVAPGEWDTEGWSIRGTDSYLVVRAPARIQALVSRALHVIAALK
jgi:hypothetical protein